MKSRYLCYLNCFLAFVFFTGVLMLSCFLHITPACAAEVTRKSVFILDKKTFLTYDMDINNMDASPFIEADRVLIPVRYLAKAMGIRNKDINWDPATRRVTLKKDDITVSLMVGSKTMTVNTQPREIDAAPLVKDGRTYLPARYLAEAFGYEVGWDDVVKAVLVGPPGQLPEAQSAGDAKDNYWRGLIAFSKREYENAVSCFSKAIEVKPDFTDAYVCRGMVYLYKEKEDDMALKDFEKAVDINSGDPFSLIGRGYAYLSKNEYNKAIQDFTEVIRLKPDYYEEGYIGCSLAYFYMKDYENALANIDQAAEINPDIPGTYIVRGLVYRDKDDLDKAMSEFNKAGKADPYEETTFMVRGEIYLLKDEYDRAIQELTRAIELNHEFHTAYRLRGMAYLEKKEYGKALGDYNKAIELNHQYAQAYLERAIVYMGKNDIAKAFNDLSKAIEQKPDMATAFVIRGELYLLKGEYDKAVNDYNRAIELDPDNAIISTWQVLLLFQKRI